MSAAVRGWSASSRRVSSNVPHAVLLQDERAAVEAALARVAAAFTDDNPVSAAIRYALAGGGKRLRPILCVAAFRAAGGQAHDELHLYDAAAALELIHTYSLVHDDLPCMDDDDLRRGRATTHRRFGTGAAMLAGFALIPFACRVLYDAARALGLEAPCAGLAVRELCRAAGATGLVAGQVLDLEAEGATPSLAELRRIHTLKTGSLFAGSLRVGAVLARAQPAIADVLGEFGTRLGVAFQITDDVLDVTMDAAALGKTPGKDAETAKATFASVLGIDGARAAARAEAAAALDGLRAARLETPLLEALARFAVDRDR
jgi:geranylgeranyl pyrophosphate synthase